jgi:hypothetical protein
MDGSAPWRKTCPQNVLFAIESRASAYAKLHAIMEQKRHLAEAGGYIG